MSMKSTLCNGGGLNVDITQSMARIVVNGKDLPFTSVRTSRWHIGPVDDLIVSTKQRVEAFYQFMWSRVPMMIVMYFLQGAEYVRFTQIIGINESITGEYTYYFSWG
ncbi:hypothetical protein ACRS6Y_18720 [Bacillus cytotoxicus]|uniref:Uncharacterized protein n=1 Tax=Bacillus cytotoxicus (strain DSM 22905 / CIP 110041 / 391-98 / NVH 391-98) TaxID=315749 RepID=A7GR41_BACCN|nr:hypothetical protein [Bacillus cytotoxicus]ABS22599.1 conserved hypothetical protein [Bacillus cytotoxicus NVH 391-98]AWC45242.1 hypothetical protein CG479_012625 [Bacillus cytotoxicus]MDH2865702.1 hypothetical protein [Bacillus cytotoxicus]MDH2885718.1 hypothetical protein [Bacillus cytotoxicus]NZD34207.1 hypothetical protein [Bacillus cytotoxicus]